MYKFFTVSVAVLAFFYVFIILGWMYGYSDGQRTGDIYKFSKKGIFIKSWEGEMYLGGYHSTGGDSPTLETDRFQFSVPADDANADLIADLQECASMRKPCTVYYTEWLKAPIDIDTSYVATDVMRSWLTKIDELGQ